MHFGKNKNSKIRIPVVPEKCNAQLRKRDATKPHCPKRKALQIKSSFVVILYLTAFLTFVSEKIKIGFRKGSLTFLALEFQELRTRRLLAAVK